MAFVVPQFNLLCNVWHGQAPPPVGAPDIAILPCQLAWDVLGDKPFVVGTNVFHLMKVRVPILTDLRGTASSTGRDVVEIPASSGRFYIVHFVDDVARGFGNEYRAAGVQLADWPTPLP